MQGRDEHPLEVPHQPPSLPGDASAARGRGGEASRSGDVRARGGRRRRWPARTAFGIVAVLVIAAIIACFVQIPYYAITPGQAIDVSSMITLPKSLHHPHKGVVLMTDVNLVPLRAIDYPFFRWNGDDQVDPTGQIFGPATSAQYDQQGIIDMVDARQAATVVALRELGYHVRAVPSGVVVYQPMPGSPAATRLPVGDVITAVDGRRVLQLETLLRVLAGYSPGQLVALTVHSFDSTTAKEIAKTTAEVRLHLGETRWSNGSEVCLQPGTKSHLALPPAGVPRACLGIASYQAYRTVGLPFKVTIDSEGIIGPSAGLAFTLGLLNELDGGKLTAGRKIAATGTMSVTGQVGDVGGVPQKTVAVRRAGATIFFVPPPEYFRAKAHAGPHLRVVAVSTLDQAVKVLERLGGRLGARASLR